jgi:hypothetical protein
MSQGYYLIACIKSVTNDSWTASSKCCKLLTQDNVKTPLMRTSSTVCITATYFSVKVFDLNSWYSIFHTRPCNRSSLRTFSWFFKVLPNKCRYSTFKWAAKANTFPIKPVLVLTPHPVLNTAAGDKVSPTDLLLHMKKQCQSMFSFQTLPSLGCFSVGNKLWFLWRF